MRKVPSPLREALHPDIVHPDHCVDVCEQKRRVPVLDNSGVKVRAATRNGEVGRVAWCC